MISNFDDPNIRAIRANIYFRNPLNLRFKVHPLRDSPDDYYLPA